MDIVIHPDAGTVAVAAAERVVAAAAAAVEVRGRFTIALAGGSTPALLYELLAEPEFTGRVDWPFVHVFFGDERCVPPDHEWSNYGMTRRTLLARVPIPPGNVYRIAGELGSEQAAAAYDATLRTVLAPSEGRPPRFDLILLGMGDDGHTASLFPDMPVLSEERKWAAGTPVPGYVRPQVSRVTLTLPVLDAGRAVLFLVTGAGKAGTVRRVLGRAQGDASATALPAARVRPEGGMLTWLLDEAAAALLKGPGDG